MTSTAPTGFVLRRLVPAALIAAATALGINTFADPVIANANQRVWDVGQYNDCVLDVAFDEYATDEQRIEFYKACCEDSGGVWDDDGSDDIDDCGADPVDYQRPLPPRMAPGAETSAPLEPITPTTQTFVPGPPRQG
jgi:hypothetical protein